MTGLFLIRPSSCQAYVPATHFRYFHRRAKHTNCAHSNGTPVATRFPASYHSSPAFKHLPSFCVGLFENLCAPRRTGSKSLRVQEGRFRSVQWFLGARASTAALGGRSLLSHRSLPSQNHIIRSQRDSGSPLRGSLGYPPCQRRNNIYQRSSEL